MDSLGAGTGGLGRYALALVGLALAQAAAKFTSRRSFLGVGRAVEHDLRAAYAARLLRLPLARLEADRKGDLVSRATHDLQDVRVFVGVGALNFLQTAVLLVVATGLLWRLDPALTAAALAPLPVVALLVRAQSPRLHRRYLRANERAGELAALVQEALGGLRVARSFGREGWLTERFEAANGAARDAQVGVVRSWAALYPLVGAVAALGHVAVLGLGGAWVARGTLTLGEFVAFNAYLAMLTWPMMALGWTLSLAQRGAAALERLRGVLDAPPEPEGKEPLPGGNPAPLAARDLGFTHAGAVTPTLAGVTCSLAEGEYRGLVGATGAGKSTLVHVLAGLRPPGAGSVTLGGVPLAARRAADVRAHLAVVSQDARFFADTVAANVCLGRPRDDARLIRVLAAAGLAAEVAELPQGVDSVLGEGGVTLSGGQRQRLAVARALYGDPRLLILDSALSSLDTATARRVLAGVRESRPGLGLLVVSHRGSEVDDADGVWFLEGGRVAAEGRHRDLLERVPAYQRLYREEELRRELAEERR